MIKHWNKTDQNYYSCKRHSNRSLFSMLLSWPHNNNTLTPQEDHPLCWRPRDERAIRFLISYIFCNLLRLTSDWFKWSWEMLHKILDFASQTVIYCRPWPDKHSTLVLLVWYFVVWWSLESVNSSLAVASPFKSKEKRQGISRPLKVLALSLFLLLLRAATASKELTDSKPHQTTKIK